MKTIKKARRAGKTTEAIALANETGAYLICLNEQEKRRIREECARNPVSFSELNDYGMKGSFVRNVVVDNFDMYFEQRLSQAIKDVLAPLDGLKIDGISFSESPEDVAARVVGNVLKRYLR